MAFESLSNRLTAAFKHVVGKDRLSEKNTEQMLKEIRMALLEADVNYQVTKQFIDKLRTEIIGMNVSAALDPSQQVYKIVYNEIVQLLGESQATVAFKEHGLTIIMIVGLQGTGKTTSAAKLAKIIRDKNNRKPLLIAGDIIRPAAIEQLQTLGKQINVDVFTLGTGTPVVETVGKGIEYAQQNGLDTVIIDTAGRLAIDEALMAELADLKAAYKPDEILLTVDALTGQDIVNTAKRFDDLLKITGLIVTKFDGDSRGGGVLSVKAITDVPVKLVGTGEKIEDVDYFYPDRMASRILGMGDLETLIEQAEAKMDEEASQKTVQHMMEGKFTLDDLLVQMHQMKKMGPLGNIMKMIPGMNQYSSMIENSNSEGVLKKFEAIICSMTPYEREHPDTLRNSHKNRIAKGSGTTVNDVNKLLNSFERTKKMLGQMGIGRARRF